MEENWYALCIAILKTVSVEQALKYFGTAKTKRTHNSSITQADLLDMIELKKTMSYREIGEIYELTDSACHHRISRFKKDRSTAMETIMCK